MKRSIFSKIAGSLLTFMMLVLFSSTAMAGTNYDYVAEIHPNKASVSYEPKLGYFKIEFYYYYNPTKSAKDVCLRGGSYISAVWDGNHHRVMDLEGCSDCEHVDFSNCPQDNTNGWVKATDKWTKSGRFSQNVGDGTAAKATFYYYPPESALGKKVTFYFYFNIDEDQDGEGAMTRDYTWSQGATLPNISTANMNLSASYSNTVGKLDVTAQYTGGSVPDNLYFESTAFGDATKVTLKEDRKVNGTTIKKKVYLKYSEKLTKTVELSTAVKGYQAIKNFGATYGEDGKVHLSWNLESATGSCEAGYFRIERSEFADFTNATILTSTLTCLPTQTSYSFDDDLVAADVVAEKLYYRITRTVTFAQWGFDFGATDMIEPDYKHVNITSANAELITVDDHDAIKVTWTYNNLDYIWSTGSEFCIVRDNTTAGTTQVISGLTKNNIADGEYIDKAIQMCNTYTYTVYVLPGNLAYKSPRYTTARLTPSSLGNLEWADASKGYYSDRIELEWQSVGTFDQFAISRRLHGDTVSEWRAIQTVSGASVLTHYTASDATAYPGYAYDYMIVGMLTCSDSTITSNEVYATGFRIPTGDFYGRVTFEDGQAEDSVEVRLSSEDEISGQSLSLAAADYAELDNQKILSKLNASATLQAWVRPNALAGEQHIISKNGCYDLGINGGHPYFKYASTTLTADTITLSATSFTHLTAVLDADAASMLIYVDGRLVAQRNVTLSSTVAADVPVRFGEDFAGYLEEVRLWERALGANEISTDFGRHIVGNESGLIGYYTFDFIFDNLFFDLSYTIADYHKNHGKLHGGEASTMNPTINQLAYKGITNASGTYSIRAVPYYGNGTAYTLTPRKGVHQFSPVSEVRFINADAQSHTVNFTDNSSFDVSGTVRYAGGTFPVEGAMFMIDGQYALNSNGTYRKTNANGQFNISVPVGTHEVKVVMQGHTFENGGRITTSDGQDRNYQDIISGIELTDNTRVKYVGRIAGGTIQEAYPVGLSASTNNLGEGIKLVLSQKQQGKYQLDSLGKVETLKHYNTAYTNTQTTTADDVTITVNDTTGEFVAYLIPITYGVSIQNTNYSFGTLQDIDLASCVTVDTMQTDGVDTVRMNKMQKFIKRFEPVMAVRQVVDGVEMDYFGEKDLVTQTWDNNVYHAKLYDEATGAYLFGRPVFDRAEYTFNIRICETYTYYDKNGIPVWTDSVPTQDATIEFTNELNDQIETVEADSLGRATYVFQAIKVDATSAEGHIWAKVALANSSTTFDWVPPFANGAVYTLGFWSTGENFVTAGPNRVLTVLRDPPGSTSYAYLEKGVSFSESSTYTGSVENEGFQGAVLTTGAAVTAWTGVGGGTITVTSATSTAEVGAVHSEQYQGADTKNSTTTVTTRYQTSDDPLYVGANGDVYIGYATNIAFGTTQNISILPRTVYNNKGGENGFSRVYDTVPADWVLVQTTGHSVDKRFSTTFAYPQVFIEQTLIPNLEDLRNSMLLAYRDSAQIDSLQAVANALDTIFYVSYIPYGDELFGLKNTDPRLDSLKSVYGNPKSTMDGPSYVAIYSPSTSIANLDTISTLNQWIDGWKYEMGKNELAKLNAIANGNQVANYSVHAGANIEYSETYSAGKAHESSFTIQLGAKATYGTELEVSAGTKNVVSYKMEEQVTTTQGGTFTSEAERSHCKGYYLGEDGDDDYLSITVYREADWDEKSERYDYDGPLSQGNTVDSSDIKDKDYFSSFVFVTEAGATSCPYEGAYTTKYLDAYNEWMTTNTKNYKPIKNTEVQIGKPTLKLEDPYISMENNFIENVPSGEAAYFTIYMRNNSETGEDQWFNIITVDGSNPDGALISIDGNTISGFQLQYLVPAGETLVKTMAVEKGRALNYDNLQIVLASQCQADPTSFLDVIADTITFSVHFTPSCTNLDIISPSDNWTYNTKCETAIVNDLEKHFMPVKISNFDVNYTDFHHIELQYKPASASDNDWSVLCYYYADDSLTNVALANGFNAETINASDAGTISYKFFMDELSDQKYDLRAVSVCNINNTLYENPSPVVSGIKDMYNPRLFGAAKPANGILTVEDEIRLDFNEAIAEGLLTENNFSVTGIRNGAATSHDVAVQLDGTSAYLSTELSKNYSAKNLTIEGWIKLDQVQDATIFSHGNASQSLAFAITSGNYVKVRFGKAELTSAIPASFQLGSWNHVALTFDAATQMLTAYVNWVAVIEEQVADYKGIGLLQIGRDIQTESGYFNGKVDQFRVWNAARTSSQLQANAAVQLSGNNVGLIGYYAMDEAVGTSTADKARGVNMILYNAEWALPDGYATQFDGKSGYLEINSSATVITQSMDYTLEFWFKTDKAQHNATMLSNGDGVSKAAENPLNLFSIGWNNNGTLCYRNNGYETEVPGNWCDGEWHNFALAVSRSSGHARIYMDGELNTYIAADMVGGVSSDKIFAGARVWYSDPQNAMLRTADQFFDGKLDEIRIWNLYRTQSQMKELNNEKLEGDEIGLLSYYPFEHYTTYQGVAELNYTLKDYVTDTLLATVKGTAMQTSDLAPVKTKGAVSKLLYDFVVNNDALIITLKEDDYRIENTIVNFTVKDVRDLNGNSILSPITWSAYIDRNQLAWQEDDVELTMNQYDNTEFTVGVINKGGFVQNYTIENLPSWLTASPEAGTINPTKSAQIKFTVDPGLNVGTYNEVIYLVDAQNVSEPLTITITVLGTEPEWSVNPADYQYNMSVFGKMRIDGVFSDDENDILAAFDGNTCVGVARTSYNKATDMYYVLMSVYSNSQKASKELSFRIYDASTGVTYAAAPSQQITFLANGVVGSPKDPVIFDGANSLFGEMNLTTGWNWVSFNLASDALSNVNQALAGASWYNGEEIKNRTTYASYSERRAAWMTGGGLKTIDNKQMYMIHVNSDRVMSVSGDEIDPSTMPITIAANGWTYLGYLPNCALPVKSALAGYDAAEGDMIKSQDGFAMYYGNEWIGSLTYMTPGQGYMIKNTAKSAKVLVYPSKASTVNRAPQRHIAAQHPYNMSIFAHSAAAQEGDIIYAIVGGEIVGEAVAVPYENGITLQCISISGNEGNSSVHFVLVRGNETFTATTTVDYAANAVCGSPSQPVEIEFTTTELLSQVAVYPVPAVTDINITAVTTPGEQAHVEIYDVCGKKVMQTPAETTSGLYMRSINVSELGQGAYFLHFVHGKEASITKFVKF